MLNYTPGNWIRQRLGLRWKGPRPTFRENAAKIGISLLVALALLALYAYVQALDEADRLRTQQEHQRPAVHRQDAAELEDAKRLAVQSAVRLYEVEQNWRRFMQGGIVALEPTAEQLEGRQFSGIYCKEVREVAL